MARARQARKKGPTRRPYHHGDLRAALIKAALGIVEEQGVAGLTLRGVARQAGVSHAAPAHHFGDLRGLLAAVAAEGYRNLHTAMLESLAAKPDAGPMERLEAVGVAYAMWAVRTPGCFRVMFHPLLADRSTDAELEDAAHATYRVLVGAIVACQEAGAVRAGDPTEIALTAWSTVHGLATLAVDGQLRGWEPERLAPIVANNVLRGFSPSEHPSGAPAGGSRAKVRA